MRVKLVDCAKEGCEGIYMRASLVNVLLKELHLAPFSQISMNVLLREPHLARFDRVSAECVALGAILCEIHRNEGKKSTKGSTWDTGAVPEHARLALALATPPSPSP
ncbi:hypothetical protein SAMN05428962_4664 [Paenibacillus sp. BC26]|nr:hypothetical protein SAMN05428962_4664 [Paenibacillus sp. BC26]